MKYTILLLLCLFSSRAFAGNQTLRVSLVQLLATPERYNGKTVQVTGYLHLQFEDTALYFSKEDAQYGSNALWVGFANDVKLETDGNPSRRKRLKLSSFDCRHVLVQGVFDSSVRGHLGSFPGGVTNISRIVELKRVSFWKRLLLRTAPRAV